jgi:putative intracellular protease/amidase
MRRTSIALVGSGVLAACASGTIVRPVGQGGRCVPVVCPAGTIEIEGVPWAARLDGDALTLLLETPETVFLRTVGGGATEVRGLGEVRGSIAAAAPLPDGFVVVTAPDLDEIYEDHSSYEPIPMEVSRVVGADASWTQAITTSSLSRSPDAGLALAVDDDELALAHLVDERDPFDSGFVVERRSLATGELIEHATYSNGTTYASLDLAYTERGLVFVWSPSSSLAGTRMFMALDGGDARALPRSWNNGAVALTSSGALVVEQPSLTRGRVRMDGRTIAKLVGSRGQADHPAVIESDAGTAVTLFASEWANEDRQGFEVIVGDSGVGLRLSRGLDGWGPAAPGHALRLDRGRMLHVDEREVYELAIVGCAGSSAVDGLTCETPESSRL